MNVKRQTISTLLILMFVGTGTSCASARDRAIEEVSNDVKQGALRTRELLVELMQNDPLRRGPELLDYVMYNWPAGEDVIVFTRNARPDGAVVIGSAFHSFVDRSTALGFSGDRFVARICVEYVGIPGPVPTATVDNVACPSTIPPYTGNAGNIDVVVQLDDQ